MLQLGLGLGLGTGNGYFMPFFPYLKVTNTIVLPSWAEAWCKCDVMRFIRDCLHGSLPKKLLIGVNVLNFFHMHNISVRSVGVGVNNILNIITSHVLIAMPHSKCWTFFRVHMCLIDPRSTYERSTCEPPCYSAV